MFLQQQPDGSGAALSDAYQSNMRMLNQLLMQQRHIQQLQQQQQSNQHSNTDDDFGVFHPTEASNSHVTSAALENTHQCVTQAALLPQGQADDAYAGHSHGNVVEDGSDTGGANDAGSESRFRMYQADAWTSMLEELIEFRKRNGHCNVPHTSKELPALGRWVKRQRYQYKLMQEGKKESTMTPERAQVLEQVGFVWDAHGSTWHRRFKELHAFYLMQGHTNVPSNFPANPQLSTWVKFQRRQYKALRNGGKAKNGGASGQSLTPVRIRALEELGFQWELRKSRK